MSFNATVILRHNITLDGDIRLAVREINALAGATGRALNTAADVAATLDDPSLAKAAELNSVGGQVALGFAGIPSEAIHRIAFRSAFAQEVFVNGPREQLIDLASQTALPKCLTGALLSAPVLVIASLYYLVESESVLEGTGDRLRQTGALLLEPYAGGKVGTASKRIRRAKKTSLTLSHDLHIYKAKFFPRMVRALLNIFGTDSAKVFDPYCGSGTALLESSLLGFDAYGMDIDPICELISLSKVEPFRDKSLINHDIKILSDGLRVAGPELAGALTQEFPAELKGKLVRKDAREGTSFAQEVIIESGLIASVVKKNKEQFSTKLPLVLASDAVTKKVRYRFVGVGNGKYTIEVVNQPIVNRIFEKTNRCLELASVFSSISSILPWSLGRVTVSLGDARDRSTWPIQDDIDVIVTSPPYLPASSGREHYASSRALAFYALGFDTAVGYLVDDDPSETLQEWDTQAFERFPESQRLLEYLASDSDRTDPQRDPMRFARKAVPTKKYLEGIIAFFKAALDSLSSNGRVLMVVASEHTFYSHKRSEIEYVVNCRNLYGELAMAGGLRLTEEIRLELAKAANSRARPRATERYYESVLVFEKQ